MAKHTHSKPELDRPTTVDTKESTYGDKDVALTIWQGVYGHTTEHSWQEVRELHAQLGNLLHEAGQVEVEYEYAVQLRDSDRSPWVDWKQDEQVWGTKGRIERYLGSWVGHAACWHDMQYRVFRRPKAGAAETIAEGMGHDTTPASF